MNWALLKKISLLSFSVVLVLGVSSTTLAMGVTVGSSSLFDTTDYGDTFTGTDDGGLPDRPYVAVGQPPMPVEQTFGNPAIMFQVGAGFSFASDGPGTPGLVDGAPPYPLGSAPNASGAGSNTGFTQSGGGVDYGIAYGLRDEYVVQVDAVQVPDRIDISSGGSLGIFAPNSLSVFFRGDGTGNASIFNGAADTTIPALNTGIAGAGEWHNYAVRFDQIDQEIELYVDQASVGVVDLTTFAGGIYQGFSNAVVGAGGSPGSGNRTWTDNFQVGGNGPAGPAPEPYPDPGNISNPPAGLVSFWDFDEGTGPNADGLLNFAYDRVSNNDGSFLGTTSRTAGLGVGAVEFHDADGEGVNVGTGGGLFSLTSGITIEALFTTTWDGSDQAEFFRKEDGDNRILLSFQTGDPHINNNFGQLVGTAGVSGISLGLNTGGAYGELDIALDGLDGRPMLAQVADGQPHHLAATYDAATGVKTIYLDGSPIGSVDLGDNVPLATDGLAAAFIGSTNGGEPFVGGMDEVAVWNRALSQAEIGQHIANALAGNNYFVPEPTSAVLACLGCFGLVGFRRRPAAKTVAR